MHIFHLTPTQLVWNGVVQDIKSCAHLSPHTYTAGVEWCGIGHLELYTSFTSHLHSWCGMVWYRTSRAVHIFHLTPTQLVWNGVVQDIKSCAHLSPHTYTAGVEWCGTGHQELCTSSPHTCTAGVEWCGTGHQELCTSFTSHLHSWCGMVWYRTSRAVHIFTSHLHSWCGMVWYRTSRAVHIFHLTPTQLVWNGVV